MAVLYSTPEPESLEDTDPKKRCTMCREERDARCFYKHKEKKDGLSSYCKACAKARCRAWRQKNAEYLLQKNRRWRKERPENARASTRKYGKTHREQGLARTRRWRAKNVEHAAVLSRRSQLAWKKKAPQAFAAYYAASKQRYRARKITAPVVDFTTTEWKFLRELYDHCCAYCGKPQACLTQDHVVSFLQKGPHTLTNILPACRSCNSKKGANKFIIPHLLATANGKAREVRAFVLRSADSEERNCDDSAC